MIIKRATLRSFFLFLSLLFGSSGSAAVASFAALKQSLASGMYSAHNSAEVLRTRFAPELKDLAAVTSPAFTEALITDLANVLTTPDSIRKFTPVKKWLALRSLDTRMRTTLSSENDPSNKTSDHQHAAVTAYSRVMNAVMTPLRNAAIVMISTTGIGALLTGLVATSAIRRNITKREEKRVAQEALDAVSSTDVSWPTLDDGIVDAATEETKEHATRRTAGAARRKQQIAAATKIQAIARGAQTRTSVKEQVRAATKIQSVFRGHRGRQAATAARQQLAQQTAATQIQAMFRGHQGRNAADALRQAAERTEAATSIQSVFRGHRGRTTATAARQQLAQQTAAATHIQALARGRQARTQAQTKRDQLKTQVESAVKIQAFARRIHARNKVKALREANRRAKEAATSIQSLLRGHQGRRTATAARKQLAQQTAAATQIQALVRGNQARTTAAERARIEAAIKVFFTQIGNERMRELEGLMQHKKVSTDERYTTDIAEKQRRLEAIAEAKRQAEQQRQEENLRRNAALQARAAADPQYAEREAAARAAAGWSGGGALLPSPRPEVQILSPEEMKKVRRETLTQKLTEQASIVASKKIALAAAQQAETEAQAALEKLQQELDAATGTVAKSKLSLQRTSIEKKLQSAQATTQAAQASLQRSEDALRRIQFDIESLS